MNLGYSGLSLCSATYIRSYYDPHWSAPFVCYRTDGSLPRRYIRVSMPRYHFHILVGSHLVSDEEGEDLPDIAAARAEAYAVAREILADRIKANSANPDAVVIADQEKELARVLLVLPETTEFPVAACANCGHSKTKALSFRPANPPRDCE